MELAALGFDGWFEEHSSALLQSGHSLARVTAVDRGAFLVRSRDAETHAELAGRFRFGVEDAMDLPCVGDWVGVQGQGSGGPAMIHGVVPRKTFLRRKHPGKTVDFQMIAASLDVEKRKKDRSFGRFIKSVKKSMRTGQLETDHQSGLSPIH